MANEAVIREKTDSGFRVRYIFYFALVLLAFLAIVSYSPADAASVTGGVDAPPANWIGNLGAHLGYWLFNLFGLATYVLLVLTLLRTVRTLLPGRGRPWMFLMGEALLLLGVMLLSLGAYGRVKLHGIYDQQLLSRRSDSLITDSTNLVKTTAEALAGTNNLSLIHI
mgnify:CR=1 FL=1